MNASTHEYKELKPSAPVVTLQIVFTSFKM